MTIENRNLAVGTRLVGRYKGKEYSATVVEAEGGRVRFRLEDGREFKSLSAAGSAVVEGHACNGWRFWSLMAEQTGEATAEVEPASKARGKTRPEMEGTSSEPTIEEQQAG